MRAQFPPVQSAIRGTDQPTSSPSAITSTGKAQKHNKTSKQKAVKADLAPEPLTSVQQGESPKPANDSAKKSPGKVSEIVSGHHTG